MKSQSNTASPSPPNQMEVVVIQKSVFDRLVQKVQQLENMYNQPPEKIKDDVLYHPDQVEKMLGICRTTLTKYRNQGLIKFIQFGRSIRFRRKDIHEFMNRFNKGGKIAC